MDLTPRQTEIVEAAIQLISERSIQELTIKNLSASLGVTEAALYRHFRGKMEILTAILQMFARQAEQVRKGVEGQAGNALDRIGHIVLAHVDAFVARPPMADVVFSEEIFQNDSTLARTVHDIMKTNFDTMRLLIAKGQKQGGIRRDIPAADLAVVVVGTLRMMVTQWRLERFTTDLRARGASIWNSLRRMLEP
jgi:TetR/AcrR family transcriptional regulator, fatty acid metabolism regulator protein